MSPPVDPGRRRSHRGPTVPRGRRLEVPAEVATAAEVATEVAATGVAEPTAAPVAGAPVAVVVVVPEEESAQEQATEPGAERAHPATAVTPPAPAAAAPATPTAPPGAAVAAPVAAVPGLLRPLADVALRDLQGVLRQPVGVPCLVQGGRRVLPGHALGGVEMPLRLREPGAGLRADGAAAGADEVGGRGGRGPRGEQGLSEQFGRPAGLCLGVPRDRQ